jgi:hypothetical protein
VTSIRLTCWKPLPNTLQGSAPARRPASVLGRGRDRELHRLRPRAGASSCPHVSRSRHRLSPFRPRRRPPVRPLPQARRRAHLTVAPGLAGARRKPPGRRPPPSSQFRSPHPGELRSPEASATGEWSRETVERRLA